MALEHNMISFHFSFHPIYFWTETQINIHASLDSFVITCLYHSFLSQTLITFSSALIGHHH